MTFMCQINIYHCRGCTPLTCTKPSAATCTEPERTSQRQTYSPSCASVRKFCCRPQEGSVKNTEGPLTTQAQTARSLGLLKRSPFQLSSSSSASPLAMSRLNSAPPICLCPCKHQHNSRHTGVYPAAAMWLNFRPFPASLPHVQHSPWHHDKKGSLWKACTFA